MELMRVPYKVKVSWIWSLSMFHFDSYCCTTSTSVYLVPIPSITTPNPPVLGRKFSVANETAPVSHPGKSEVSSGFPSGCDDDEDRDAYYNSGYRFETRVEWLGHAFDPRRFVLTGGSCFWLVFRRRFLGTLDIEHMVWILVSLFFYVYIYI